MTVVQNLQKAGVAAFAMLLVISEATALDCHSLEQQNYLPRPQQPGARTAQETPHKTLCGADDGARLEVGDYCVTHLETGDLVMARVFAFGTKTIAVRALLSVQAPPGSVAVDINSSFVGPKRYFGEARDDIGRNLMARRVLHHFPQEDDVDVPPPCINSSFVTVSIDPRVLRSRRKTGYGLIVEDDAGHKLRVSLSGKIIDAVLKAADTNWASTGWEVAALR